MGGRSTVAYELLGGCATQPFDLAILGCKLVSLAALKVHSDSEFFRLRCSFACSQYGGYKDSTLESDRPVQRVRWTTLSQEIIDTNRTSGYVVSSESTYLSKSLRTIQRSCGICSTSLVVSKITRSRVHLCLPLWRYLPFGLEGDRLHTRTWEKFCKDSYYFHHLWSSVSLPSDKRKLETTGIPEADLA